MVWPAERPVSSLSMRGESFPAPVPAHTPNWEVKYLFLISWLKYMNEEK